MCHLTVLRGGGPGGPDVFLAQHLTGRVGQGVSSEAAGAANLFVGLPAIGSKRRRMRRRRGFILKGASPASGLYVDGNETRGNCSTEAAGDGRRLQEQSQSHGQRRGEGVRGAAGGVDRGGGVAGPLVRVLRPRPSGEDVPRCAVCRGGGARDAPPGTRGRSRSAAVRLR